MYEDLPDPAVFGLRDRRPDTCSLPECDDKHKALGYCSKHRLRYLATGDPRKVRKAGRHRVGEPGLTLPPTGGRGPREATREFGLFLGVDQHDQLMAAADRLVTSAGQIIRAAVAHLLAGQILPPDRPETIPMQVPGKFSWYPAPQQVDRLVELAEEHREVLDEHIAAQPVRRGPKPKLPDQRVSALIRYALARHLNPTTEN